MSICKSSIRICGIQKLTMLDYPGKTAATVFLGGCNLRCPYCHNSELIEPESWDGPDALFDLLKKRQGLLDGVCISGGEPLLQQDLEELIIPIRQMGYSVKLDTNGTMPKRLKAVCDKGLIDYVAMDIKSDRDGYLQAAGLMGSTEESCKGDDDQTDGVSPAGSLLERVSESVDYLMGSGAVDYEFRTTVVAQLHNIDTFRNIGSWIRGAKRCYLQPFVDRDTVVYSGLSAPSDEELLSYRDILSGYITHVEIRGR